MPIGLGGGALHDRISPPRPPGGGRAQRAAGLIDSCHSPPWAAGNEGVEWGTWLWVSPGWFLGVLGWLFPCYAVSRMQARGRGAPGVWCEFLEKKSKSKTAPLPTQAALAARPAAASEVSIQQHPGEARTWTSPAFQPLGGLQSRVWSRHGVPSAPGAEFPHPGKTI